MFANEKDMILETIRLADQREKKHVLHMKRRMALKNGAYICPKKKH